MKKAKLMNRLTIATALLSACLGLALPLATQAKTSVAVGTGGVMEVTLNIELIGPGTSDELAAKWSDWIEKFWQDAIKDDSCMNMTVTANVTSGDDSWLPVLSVIEDSGAGRAADHYTLNALEGSAEGNDAWYVIDTNPGQYYRPWTVLGTYGSDGVGVMTDGQGQGTIIHEAGHLLGMSDHYTDGENGSTPEEGWDGNVMARSGVANSVIAALSLLSDDSDYDPTDERNFEEMINTMEEQADLDIRPCLMLDFVVETTYNNPPTNIDRLTGNMKFGVGPTYPLLPNAVADTEEINGLTGEGEGERDWTIEMRSAKTDFGAFIADNNPWPIEVKGNIEEETIYQLNIITYDEQHSVLKDGSSYGATGLMGALMSNNPTSCTVQNNSLITLRLDTEQVEQGMTCQFPINAGYYDNGQFDMTVTSIQGNGQPVQ